MVSAIARYSWVVVGCAFAAACSATPTSPSGVGTGPTVSQGPLQSLLPEGPPTVLDRIAGPVPNALGATRFLAFGDSITYGTLSSYDGSFVFDAPEWSYAVRLKAMLDRDHPGTVGAPRTYTVVNAGVPGETAAGSLGGEGRIQSAINTHRPQAVLLLEGINDLAGGSTPTASAAAVERIVNIARGNNVTVLVATMPQTYETCRPPELGGECRDNAKDLVVPFNQEVIRRLANRQNVHIVDMYAAFGTNHVYMGNDGLHPNDAGYARMAQTFLQRIEQVFGIRSSFQ